MKTVIKVTSRIDHLPPRMSETETAPRQPRRLRPADVTVTHEPPDGWWIDLPFGWVMDDGSHGIAEDTKRAALAKLSLATPCDCDRCHPTRVREQRG